MAELALGVLAELDGSLAAMVTEESRQLKRHLGAGLTPSTRWATKCSEAWLLEDVRASIVTFITRIAPTGDIYILSVTRPPYAP